MIIVKCNFFEYLARLYTEYRPFQSCLWQIFLFLFFIYLNCLNTPVNNGNKYQQNLKFYFRSDVLSYTVNISLPIVPDFAYNILASDSVKEPMIAEFCFRSNLLRRKKNENSNRKLGLVKYTLLRLEPGNG